MEVLGLSRIADLDEEAIPASLKHTGDDGNRRALIGPGRHAVILLWLTADLPPQNLTHRLTGLIGEEPEPAQTRLSPIPVLTGPVRLRPPVRGEGWVALNGPSNETHHRRSWLAFDGQARVPQRFAIDFIRVNPEGQQFSGDPAKNWSYLCYGAEALTVADGVIEAVRDGIGEGTPGQPPRIRMTKPDDMEGNYVSLRLGSGRLAIDAHLIPGSIRVRRGERVQAGQVLGLIGNSGNSTGPHLHFQVGTAPTVLSGDGLPFVFDAFYHDRELRREEIPLRDWLLHFP